ERRAAGRADRLSRRARHRPRPARARRGRAAARQRRQLAPPRGPGARARGRNRGGGQQRVGHRAGPLLDLRSGAAQEDGGGSGEAHRHGARASAERARARGRAAQGEEPAASPAGAEPEDREREGQPARVLRHRARRLPRHVRARGGVGEGRRRGREARGRRLPPAGEADGGRARAGPVLAALTAGTLTRGTGKLSADELARAIDSLGGRISASPGTDGTIVTAEFLSQDFAAGLDLLRQVLLDPAFARDEVRRRRDEQAADIVAALENTSAIADQCFAGFLYGAHPYGRPIEGLSTTVPKLGRGDVADFYERWYRPNDT